LVLLCSSLNFALKSEQEQNALVFQFQNFINSLPFPIQILVQSRQLDLTSYLHNLDLLRQTQESPLFATQITEYIDFIRRLIQVANIMDKKFFVTLSWQSATLKPEGVAAKLRGKRQIKQIPITEEQFNIGKEDLVQRGSVIASGLSGMGIRAVQLSTKELIDLLYQSYNFETAAHEKLIGGPRDLLSPIIQKQPEGVTNA